MRLENDLPKSYHKYSQSTESLRSQAYTKENKNYSNFGSPCYDSQISSSESSLDEKYSHFHDIKVFLRSQTAGKVSTTLITPTRNIKSQHSK